MIKFSLLLLFAIALVVSIASRKINKVKSKKKIQQVSIFDPISNFLLSQKINKIKKRKNLKKSKTVDDDDVDDKGEEIEYDLLEDVFSSSGGIVGNDRFSKALRADSGISYSPHASFHHHLLHPNTNISSFFMSFQTPNNRLVEGIQLAEKTWNHFRKNGITQDELEFTKISSMNRLLGVELTIFDKSNILQNEIRSNQIFEEFVNSYLQVFPSNCSMSF
jgi:hypothetical protein